MGKRERKKDMGSSRTRAGNSDNLQDWIGLGMQRLTGFTINRALKRHG